MSSPDSNTIGTRTLFTWTIKNFEMCTQKTTEVLRSPEFSAFDRQKVRYCIWLYPRGCDKDSENHLSVDIISSFNEGAVCSIEIGIMTARGKLSLFRHTGPSEFKIGMEKFLDRESLSSADNKHAALRNGNLNLYCAITHVGSPGHRQTTSPDAELLELSEAFGKAYEEGLFTDMEVQTKEKTFRVHKSLIRERIPWLNLYNDDLASIEGKTADALLHYIYTGRLNNSDYIHSPVLFSHIKSFFSVRSRNIKAETIIPRKSVSFTWNVECFRSLTSNDLLTYSMFGGDMKSWLNVTLTASSNEPSDDDNVLFCVTRYSRKCKRIVCRISALDRCNTFKHTFDEEDCWKIPAFARRSEVVDKGSDVASFIFEVLLTDGTSTSCVNSIQLSPYSPSSSDIVDDLEAFRDDLGEVLKEAYIYGDIQLITSLDFECRINCHRFVLAARSPGFRKMFEMCENLEEIVIGPVEERVVNSMLHYLYTGMIQDLPNLEKTLDLYELANRYDIPGLKKESMRRIKSKLSADTLGEVLLASDKWNDAELKGCVFDFVYTFPRLVLESTRLQEELRSRSDLALEILNGALTCLSGENNGSKEIQEPD